MTNNFHRTTELNGSCFLKTALKSATILNIESDYDYCFFWSKLAHLNPWENYQPKGVSKYVNFLRKLNIEGIDFSKGFNCGDVHRFERKN